MNRTFTLNRIIPIALYLLLAGSCGKETTDQEHKEEQPVELNRVELSSAQWKTAGIDTGRAELRQISGTIKVSGVLDVPPQQLVSVSAPLGGFLKNTVLLPGSRVRKGQVIATIENLDFVQIQQDYLEAKSQLELTKADFERQRQLAKENINSLKALQQSKASYSTWRAKYNGLREKLKVLDLDIRSVEEGNITSSINLFSPINGYVTKVNVNIGTYVRPSDILFELVDTRHLHVQLTVFEKDFSKLRIGQKVRFTLANEAKERLATLYLIGREINPDRTIHVHCHLAQEDTELLPGMYLAASIETGGATVPALPSEAIVGYGDKQYIFIASGTERSNRTGEARHHFEMIEIETGSTEFGYTEVTSPRNRLDAHANVVIKGAYALLSKMKNNEEVDEP